MVKCYSTENCKIKCVSEEDNEPQAPPAPVISTEYDAEEDEGDSDDDNTPAAPEPPVISKQEVKIWLYHEITDKYNMRHTSSVIFMLNSQLRLRMDNHKYSCGLNSTLKLKCLI